MDALCPGIGNIFVQASNLFGMRKARVSGCWRQLQSLQSVALATAALGSALTANRGADGVAPAVDLLIQHSVEHAAGGGVDPAGATGASPSH
ncbi:MAG: hypothetical protein R2911_41000 [Caldilineaceae bacterium]